MFKVNDTLSDVSASLKAVKDGDRLLWYQGTTQNAFQGPSWKEMTGEAVPDEYTEISSKEDLIKLQNGEYPLDGKYRLTADIDMSGVDFRGIGAYDGTDATSSDLPEAARKPFSGEFDGAGHIISNLTINRPKDHNVGFFNFIRGAKIHDLTLENADITGLYSVGGIAGVADVKLDTESAENCVGNMIGRCRVTGSVKSANTDTSGVPKGSYTGGIIGFNNGDIDSKTGISIYSSVDQCVSEAEVTGGAIYVGGLAGGNYGYITDSRARGKVTGDRCAGGFVGGNNGSIINCAAEGSVSGAEDTGGFAGTTLEVVRHCFSTGAVKASGNNAGGFAGSASGQVKECASAGKVTPGASDLTHGGFAGSYKGKLAGLEKDIQFKDNRGYSVLADGSEAGAIGNMYSSTIESEQKVLDETKVTDWSALQDFFRKMYGVTLNEDGTVTWPEEESPGKDSRQAGRRV